MRRANGYAIRRFIPAAGVASCEELDLSEATGVIAANADGRARCIHGPRPAKSARQFAGQADRARPGIGENRLGQHAHRLVGEVSPRGGLETALPLEFLQLRDDLRGNDLDLAHFVLVGHEYQLLHADRKMLLELRDAFVDRADDGAVLGGIAP